MNLYQLNGSACTTMYVLYCLASKINLAKQKTMLADLPPFSQSKRVFFSTPCVAWKKHQKRVRLWNSLAVT
jgi:hypothetical protein